VANYFSPFLNACKKTQIKHIEILTEVDSTNRYHQKKQNWLFYYL